VKAPQGQFNPMQVFAEGIGIAVKAAVDAAEPTSTWVVPPSRFGGSLGEAATGVRPLVLLTDPEVIALSRVEAASLGWTGPMRSALFVGRLRGLRDAFNLSRTRLAASAVILGALQAGSLLHFIPAPLPEAALHRAIAGQWSANPMFSGSGSAVRDPVALACARVAAAVWARVQPIAVGGAVPPPGGTVTGVFPVNYL